ncbi:hypothetical protein RJ40_07900 [Methanofollis aquaemaris]|uniref:Lipoprotein n=1 Tax=Methanofollis aquaemaris TaxID=126734 RepID=A0A8A3S5U3_9EURY|nr:hypothetical protein [Methanofollis aquaemaris]QSZ67432.1 hypothetical protein RJ40_07900 [Methanofollis aquaemaris]
MHKLRPQLWFALLIVFSIIIGGCIGNESDNDATQNGVQGQNEEKMISHPIFEWEGATEIVLTNMSRDDEIPAKIADTYDLDGMPETIERYDLVRFGSFNLDSEKTNAVEITIHGDEYEMTLDKMGPEKSDGALSYVGEIGDEINSSSYFEIKDDQVSGMIVLPEEIILIESLKSKENSASPDAPLHLVLSTDNIDLSSRAGYAEMG